MSRDPHPFTEIPDSRRGHHVYEFEFGGMALRLTTIAEPAASLVFSNYGFGSAEPMPTFSVLSFPGTLSVETVVTILSMRDAEFERGRNAGIREARAGVRAALGL